MLGFLLGSWKQIAALLLVALVVSVWLRFQALELQAQAAAAELARTRQMLAAAEDRLAINEAARSEREVSEGLDRSTRSEVERAQREITDAATRQDAHAMYVAWSGAIERLWDEPSGSGA